MGHDMDLGAAARECIGETDRMVRRHGPRLAGGAACTAAAEEIAESLRDADPGVRLQRFAVHPGSFYSYTKILPVSYALGVAAFFLPPALAVVPCAGLVLGIALMICQFGVYNHLGDRLFRRRTGVNVEAVIEPAGIPKRELIISGHHDSAPVARIFSGPLARVYVLAISVPYLFFALGIALLVVRIAGGDNPAARAWILPVLAVGLLFVAGYFLMVDTRHGSPGAGDNLVSSLMAARVGREVALRRTELLRSTRLRVVSFDAEEAGLRGASAYFRARAAEGSGLPCWHLNFDSLYGLSDLQVLTSDINGIVPLSAAMVEDVAACAAEVGVGIRRFGLLFGAGGTDAAESARTGMPSTTVIAMSTSIVRDGLVYHTPRDTAEHVEPATVEACMRIALAFLARLESAG